MKKKKKIEIFEIFVGFVLQLTIFDNLVILKDRFKQNTKFKKQRGEVVGWQRNGNKAKGRAGFGTEP